MIPVIAVGFALLGALLLWFVIGSRGRWWLKLTAIVGTCAFTFAVWHALDSFSGWSTDERPPAHAVYLGGSVDEPHAIYLWLIPSPSGGLLRYKPASGEPRAYRLPYSRELHAQVDRGNQLAKRGQPLQFELGGKGRATSARGGRGGPSISRFLPPSLPRKEQQ
jgi:hypothetical protein